MLSQYNHIAAHPFGEAPVYIKKYLSIFGLMHNKPIPDITPAAHTAVLFHAGANTMPDHPRARGLRG
jgi:hypothetical protein